MSPYRENPAMEAPIAPTQERSRPPRCQTGSHLPVIDAINMCIACKKCGCALDDPRNSSWEVFDARRDFETAYFGGFKYLHAKISGDGELRQDYWHIWNDSGRKEKVPNTNATTWTAIVVIAAMLIIVVIVGSTMR